MGTANAVELTASYYSVESLKAEGTWAKSRGVMADGNLFRDDQLTAACWRYPIGAILRVVNSLNGRSVVVVVTDRTARRFAKTRIDLSKKAFSEIDGVKQGLVAVQVERLK